MDASQRTPAKGIKPADRRTGTALDLDATIEQLEEVNWSRTEISSTTAATFQQRLVDERDRLQGGA